MNYFEPWFECVVPGNNMYVVIPSDNGSVLVKYPFAYGDVIYVQQWNRRFIPNYGGVIYASYL